MRRTLSTICVLFATLLLSPISVGAEDYRYPYRDPYLATATSAILNADRVSPRLLRQVVHVPGLPGRSRLPGLEGRDSLSVALYRQNHPAPLVFILCGIGTNPYFGPATYYANLFHHAGSHVVILPSPMSWNFALASSRTAAPGYALDDARDLYDAMQTILSLLRSRYAMKISEVTFLGTSLGALEGAYLSVIDTEQRRIGIGKYLLANPPLDLRQALAKVDAGHKLGAKFGAERSERIVTRALAILAAFSRDRRDDPTIFASVVRDFAGFTREELQFLIAADLQAGLPDLVYVTRTVQAPTTGAAARYQVRRRLEDAREVTLVKYLEEIALPIWRRQAAEPRADLDTFLKRGSLASILDRLRANASVRIVHNADDFLTDRKSLEELKNVLGDQMILYPYGGHLGNLWYAENRESVLRFFQTTDARSTPIEEVRRSR